MASLSLHPNEHDYQAGKSVETALLRLVVWVKKAMDQQETALAVFLDIEGVFNNTSYDSMCAALFKHGVAYTILWWIRATLEGCMAAVTLGGFSKRVAVSRVCSHGGMLLPLLWCLVVDGLIARLTGGGIYTQGCVDGICLLAVGKFPNTVSGLIQWALHIAETWYGEVGLLVNPDNTGLIVFTRKMNSLVFLHHTFLGLFYVAVCWSSISG